MPPVVVVFRQSEGYCADMTNTTGKPMRSPQRVFLFLQGPHGPFFSELAERLRETGAKCFRVAFNAGDSSRWKDRQSLLEYQGDLSEWPNTCANLIDTTKATDLVLYGDVRRHHAEAIKIANAAGLTVHVFEEGYLRPYWATYERDGSNGNSKLMQITLEQMKKALRRTADVPALPPDRWGDLRMHMIHGALYHWHVMFRNQRFPHYKPHRDQTVAEEFRLQILRLLRRPRHIVERWVTTRRIRTGGRPYHVVLLQLEHDASFRAFSNFASQTEFVDMVIKGFAEGAPSHHRLVFKAHPLEDGRAPLERTIFESARAHGVPDRVHYVRGGKLAFLLQAARSAVTVNSTSAHQALWRGLPVRSFGTSVYDKPGLASHQSLPDFFADPMPPDPNSYAIYRQFLLETSQVPGGYYSIKGRSQMLRQVVDRMLSPNDPYDFRLDARETEAQQLRVVRS